MNSEQLFQALHKELHRVLAHEPGTLVLWNELIATHPADIARFFTRLEKTDFKKLFAALPADVRQATFAHLPETMLVPCLESLADHDKALLLASFPLDELTDFFDTLSDYDLKKYLNLLSTKNRQTVLSLLKFDPESAGGVMDTNVITLMQNFTVERSIKLLQRLRPQRELHHQIFVTDQDNLLVGHILMEDLVLKDPGQRLSTFLKKNNLIINVHEDREPIAQRMIHYGQTIVPVVSDHNYFLGVIAADTLVEIVGKEASEDVYRMSAMTPIKYTYFQTPFFRILFERCFILMLLLLAQSLSPMILKAYEATLAGFLMLYITMLISAGGNSSSQTSAVVIQGITSGEIGPGNIIRFLKREFCMAVMLASILGIFTFSRFYVTYGFKPENLVVSLSLSLIVLISIMLGGIIPLILKKLKIDPAFAAGPFLATVMDILGLMIYCYISKLLLF